MSLGPRRFPSGFLGRWRTAGLVAAAAAVLSSSGLATSSALGAAGALQATASCGYAGPSTLFVPLATTIGGILIDSACEYVYVSNTTQNRIEVYSLQAQAFEAPIAVGAAPRGMDFTPDGTLLYVANSGEPTVSVVDVATRTELRKISVPSNPLNPRPGYIAIASNGKALITTMTGSGCSGACGSVLGLTLATDAVVVRTDFNEFGGSTSENRLKASSDRSVIVLLEGHSSGGRTLFYRSETDQFSAPKHLESGILDAGINRSGSTSIVSGLFVLDAALNVTGVLAGGGLGVEPHPTLGLAYRTTGSVLEIHSLSTFLKIGERPIGDSISNGNTFQGNYVGRMDASDDGTLLAIVTNGGVSILRPFGAAPEKVNLLRNGDFADDLTHWQPSAPGDPGVQISVAGGILNLNRASASPAPDAGVFQLAGQSVPPGAPLQAQVGLGNTGAETRTIRLVLTDSDTSDPRICTFDIPAHTPLATYRMRSITTEAWSDARLSIYADTVSSDGGSGLIDNVSLMYDSTLTGPEMCETPPPPPPAGNCTLPGGAPYPVPLTGTYTAVLVDNACRYVYLLDRDQNRVELFSLASFDFEVPIQVGAMPAALDITADDTTLYIANGGGNNVSVVDLRQRVEVQKITVVPPVRAGFGVGNNMGASVAIAGNGKALVTTRSWCCTGPWELQEVIMATGQITRRPVEFAFQPAIVRASADRSTIGIVDTDVSNGPISIYRSATDMLTPVFSTNQYLQDFSINGDGSRLFLTNPNLVLDSTPAILGTFSLTGNTRGAALHPTLRLAYRPLGATIGVLDLDALTQIGSLPLGGTTDTSPGFQLSGQVDISANGRLLAVRTTTGYSLVDLFAAGPPQNFNIVQNGAFAGGAAAWNTFATPDPSYIDSRVMDGVFEFNRLPPPPGTSNQAVVFQHTGVPLPSGAPIQAQFDLGNSSSVRKRISVLLLDSNFTDLHVCTFWIPAGAPLATYRMRSHTTKAWNNAAIYFYAATAGADGGFNRIDNVSLRYDTALAADRTECEDPTAPAPAGGVDGPHLLGNGDFSALDPAPWTVFGTLTSQLAGGVFEFVRPNSTPPAGVVLQATNQAVAANEILTATFDLGNSSAVRKRVTVLLHDNNFADLSACTFWLAPGLPLASYAMSTFATQAWSNATISVYAATVGPEQWIQLDNVTFRSTPSVVVSGTDCIEPALAGPSQDAMTARTAGFMRGSRDVPNAPAGAPISSASKPDRSPIDGHVAGISDWIDLTGASQARLSLTARLLSDDIAGEVEVSVDGREWRPLFTVPASEDWTAIELDLSPWLGRRIALRFVTHGGTTRPAWLIRGLRVEIHRRR